MKNTKMAIQDRVGGEVTIAAILAAQECGDFEAIEAAEKGSIAWDEYLAHYLSNYSYSEFTLSPLTKSQSANLRWQVLEQAAHLPHTLYWVNSETGRNSVPLGTYANKREAEAAASTSDTELLQQCRSNNACRVEALAGHWQARCIVPKPAPSTMILRDCSTHDKKPSARLSRAHKGRVSNEAGHG
jgi:hypothetical protein